MQYRVSSDIFEMYPGYVRGVVVAEGIRMGQTENPEITALLRKAEADVRERGDLENVASHPRIASWREAYSRFGARPSRFLSSVEALVRRVRKGGELPYINDVAALGNVFSLRYLVPVGGHDVGEVEGDLYLRRAAGDELFTPFGTDVLEVPEAGEVVYVNGKKVLCRRWTWRQAEFTKLVLESRHIAINIDGLPPVGLAEVQAICGEMAELLVRFCGGRAACRYLTEDNLVIDLSV